MAKITEIEASMALKSANLDLMDAAPPGEREASIWKDDALFSLEEFRGREKERVVESPEGLAHRFASLLRDGVKEGLGRLGGLLR